MDQEMTTWDEPLADNAFSDTNTSNIAVMCEQDGCQRLDGVMVQGTGWSIPLRGRKPILQQC